MVSTRSYEAGAFGIRSAMSCAAARTPCSSRRPTSPSTDSQSPRPPARPGGSGGISPEETGLTASAGVSFNKSPAKIALEQNKPDGLTVITPQEADAFLENLPVGRFFGVGPVTAARMERLRIRTGGDRRHRSPA